MLSIFYRLPAVAVGLVLALALLAWTVARPLTASVDGALPALLQLASHAQVATQVAWLDTGSGEAGVDRGHLADSIRRLDEAGARAIVVAKPLEEPADSADLARVRAILDAPDAREPAVRARLQAFAAELDHDARLERAIAEAGNVVLLARPGRGAPLAGVPALARDGLAAETGFVAPLERFAARARAVGVEPGMAADADGARRREVLLVAATSGAHPSLALAGLVVASDLDLDDAAALALPALRRALESRPDTAWVPFHARGADFEGGVARWPVADLLAGRVPAAAIAGRIVVVGDGRDAGATTTNGARPLPESLALRIDSLATDSYAIVPMWWPWLITALLLLAVPLVAFAARRLDAGAALAVATLAASALVVAEALNYTLNNLWVPLVTTATIVWLATAGTVAARSAIDGLDARRAWAEAARARQPIEPVSLRREARLAAAPIQTPIAAGGSAGAPHAAPRSQPRAGVEAAASVPAAAGAKPGEQTATMSLHSISEALRQRQEEPSPEAADRLLGRAHREHHPPRPHLGRYAIEGEIGRGAMGTVFLGRDPHINRVVAIKAIPLGDEFGEHDIAEARARFFREAEMAGRLRHPGIVTVHDAGEDGGVAWIAMEYVQGRVLADHAASDRLLPAAQVLELVARIADALDYAHAQGIVHRDVKPANVIFDPATLDTKITDFGIARLTNTSATRTGVVLGTPSFMAPEQMDGRFVTRRSDLFSLGVTLFQLLAGLLPFRADSMAGLMDKIANAPHPPLRTIRPDLPPCVGLIIDKALKKDPERRYATAAEFAKALRACARNLRA